MLHGLSIGALHLHHLDSANIKNDDQVAATAAITADDRPTRRSNRSSTASASSLP